MDGSENSSSGFPLHIQQQLQQAAITVSTAQRGRGRGRGRGHADRGRGVHHITNQVQQLPHVDRRLEGHSYYQRPPAQPWGNQSLTTNPTDTNSFPPLGSPRPQAQATTPQQYQPVHTQQSVPPQHNQPLPSAQPSLGSTYNPQTPHQEYQQRGRGAYFRGRARGHHGYQPNNQYQPSHVQSQQTPPPPLSSQNPSDFHRPVPTHRKLFTPGNHPHFSSVEEQRAFQRKLMDQSDFLNYLAKQSLKSQVTSEEQQAKECFRRELEAIAQRVIAGAITDKTQFDAQSVHLKLYGSLGSGFALSGSDMDLLLAFPQEKGTLGDIEIESRRMLEKALLDEGIGARLLTNTRVPILRVCQKPSSELLKNLRDYRQEWDESLLKTEPPPAGEGFGPLPTLSAAQSAAAVEALAALDLTAAEVALPPSPIPDHARLEFVGDCGIQCDINFSNYVALHNTRLLKTYGMCDPRVRQVGVFVKSWAKARDINTPYRGTLSSYGYVLMALHYLMNVANPPVIPNLQDLARQKDEWDDKAEIKLVEGHDVRFIRDMNEVQSILSDMPRNHESVGALLRGLFGYYADPRGFRWNQDVVSIRSRGGRLMKRSKGWTEAKWSSENSNVRLRYLLAIEDPFELEHNVARTVGHSGIVAIRDEFRRAWSIIENIQFDKEARIWFWLNVEGQRILGDDLLSHMENRGDLLRKDQDFHRQKMRQMRHDLEAKEKALRVAAEEDAKSVEDGELNGTFETSAESVAPQQASLSLSSSLALIHNGESQVKNRQRTLPNKDKTVTSENRKSVEVTDRGPFRSNSKGIRLKQWTRECPAGRWLNWRDNQIRSGKWAMGPVNRMFKRLHEDFPYDSSMTVADYVIKNEMLCRRYLDGYESINKATEIQEDNHSEVLTDTITPQYGTQRFEASQTSSSLEAIIKDTDHRNDNTSQVICEERNNKSSSPLAEFVQVQSQPIEGASRLDWSKQIDKRPTLTAPKSSVVVGPHERSQEVSIVQSPTMSRPSALRAEELSHEPPFQQPEQNTDNSQMPLVPLTLYPNAASQQRPRDEDPNIMPIPRRLGFQFDPRQLADLEIIRRGGNACAQRGLEFEIEVNYEYGGMGAMANKSSSGDGIRSKWRQEGNDDSERRVPWEAKGDEQGLLKELPGSVHTYDW